jgi:alpha-glucosidase
MIISDDDRTFADCDLVYKLARPLQLKDAQWVKPGKVAWDWWHDYALTGVNFNAGINTPTYLYHIDFAAKYGIEYIIVDWKWTDKDDLTLVNPDVDIKKIISYAKSKGVGVVLWCPGYTLHRQLNKALDLFAAWGAAGVKADFFERDDQLCIRMYEDMAKATAARKMLIDFHGATKPTGLSRAYPNAINYEGVAGNEWNKLRDIITPEHKAILPFTRSLAGPVDYTPGGMRNVLSGYSVTQTLPYVRGTRCNEMALYVLYNEPLKMFCDAPTVYEKEPQVIQFLSAIPTTWDETKVLSASIGEYLVTARRTGNTWYIGAITDGQKRSLDVSCSFLKNGNYQAEIFADGDNSDRIGTDYKIEKKSLSQASMLHLSLNGGGGAVIKITTGN